MEIKISCFREWQKILVCALLFWLVVPIVILIITVLTVKKDTWTIKDEKIVHEYGLFSKNEEVIYMKDITECRLNQSLGGRIFDYGDIGFSVIGKRSMIIDAVKHPEPVQKVLRELIEKLRNKDVQEVLVSGN